MGLDLQRLNHVIETAWKRNVFYRRKWIDSGLPPDRLLRSFSELSLFPLTTRLDLETDQLQAPLGENISAPLESFKRVYRSSGSSGNAIYWGDTAETLEWAATCSRALFEISGVGPGDRLLLLLRFGMHSGAWLILSGAVRMECSWAAGELEGTPDTLAAIQRFQPNVLVGKPSRLLHLAAQGRAAGRDLAQAGLEKVICTGESCDDATRELLRKKLDAQPISRYGMTEAGSIAAECERAPGVLHLLDGEFFAECLAPDSNQPVPDGERGELVLTTLGRVDKPIVRYRTGDLVTLRRDFSCACGRSGAVIAGPIERIGSPR